MAARDGAPSRQEGRLPTIMGRNFVGHDVTLPSDLGGRPVVLLVAFRMWQQGDVDRWVTARAACRRWAHRRGDARDLTVLDSSAPVRRRRYGKVDSGQRGIRADDHRLRRCRVRVEKALDRHVFEGHSGPARRRRQDRGQVRCTAGSEDALPFVGLVGNPFRRGNDPESESDGSV